VGPWWILSIPPHREIRNGGGFADVPGRCTRGSSTRGVFNTPALFVAVGKDARFCETVVAKTHGRRLLAGGRLPRPGTLAVFQTMRTWGLEDLPPRGIRPASSFPKRDLARVSSYEWADRRDGGPRRSSSEHRRTAPADTAVILSGPIAYRQDGLPRRESPTDGGPYGEGISTRTV